MEDQSDSDGSPDSHHYRELAEKLREVARRCRLPGARGEILDLASRYDRRAEHIETRNNTGPNAG
jgi:hypothetical protein